MKNLIRIWKSRGQIYEGIRNNIFRRIHVEEIARERYSICIGCDSFDKGGSSCIMPGLGICCSECGCVIDLKVRALSDSCPRGFWKEELSDDEEEMLNEQIDKL